VPRFHSYIPTRRAEYSRIKSDDAGNKLCDTSVLNRGRDPDERDNRLEEQDKQARFEETIMPHLDAAYNLARWLTSNEHDAEDVVQDAFLRAFKFFEGFHGGNSRSWLLSIVRNTTYTWLQKNRKQELATVFDEEIHDIEDTSSNPEMVLLKNADHQEILRAVQQLPVEFREVMILRELEGMSYKEIAVMSDVPIGTVMSRLARARKQLQQSLGQWLQPGVSQ
jgi:RNA polymerase sigma-70 factor (ECF subfamily)